MLAHQLTRIQQITYLKRQMEKALEEYHLVLMGERDDELTDEELTEFTRMLMDDEVYFAIDILRTDKYGRSDD